MGLAILVILIFLAALLLWRGRRRGAGVVLAVAFAGTWAIGAWPLPQWMLDGLQNRYADHAADRWASRNAILLLGAGTTRDAAGVAEAPLYAYGRIAHALALYRRCHASGNDCKVLVSGGDPLGNGRSEAAVYGDLLRAMGLPDADLIEEGRSRTTWQNAQFSRPLLEAYRPQRLLMVTSGVHMRRALLYFAHFGLHPEPVRGDLVRAQRTGFPLAWNAALFDVALHEYYGLLQYRLYNLMGWNAAPLPPLRLDAGDPGHDRVPDRPPMPQAASPSEARSITKR